MLASSHKMTNVVLYVSILLLTTVGTSGNILSKLYKNRMRQKGYDYIIVGAGSAGAVLANRLSEDPKQTVLLLEAGGLPTGVSEVPYLSPSMIGGALDWNYTTEPQENAFLSTKEKRSDQPRGKVLGGTSTINGAQYVRGESRDYDEWHKSGATGWAWPDVLYYFKKAERQTEPEFAESGLHGVDGYQTVSVTPYATPLRDAYFQAFEHLGYKMVDINSGSPLGFSKVQGSVRDGLRCSTEKAYLRPAASRMNLDILVHAHVTKVLFDDQRTAHSVQFEWKNATYVIKAEKEIILSAGVFGSAQILMLSGVGPRNHLQELQIAPVADLPVGENLQDHVTQMGQIYLINSSVSLMESRVMNAENLADLFEGKGPLSITAGVECFAVLNTKYQDESENWPDIRFFFFSNILKFPNDDRVVELMPDMKKRDAMTILPMVARPKSKGYVRLHSANPHDMPIINPRYLSDENDLNVLVEGMKIVEELISTPPLQKFGPIRNPKVVRGCENIDTGSEEYLRCMARRLTQSSYHPCCTCKMGDPKDPTTVVDPQLRVKGVRGLRVVDASIMPAVTSGNTNAPSIMIGEKAADLIKGKRWDSKIQRLVDL